MAFHQLGSIFRVALWTIGTFILPLSILAQGYDDITADSGIQTSCGGLWGAGVSVFDFNGDNLDDITLCSGDGPVEFYVNNGDLTFSPEVLGIQYAGSSKTALWVDYDNDADYDLFVNGFGGIGLYENTESGMVNVTEESGLEQSGATGSGASFGDVNNDGWLDLYICNYDYLPDSYENYFYLSDGEGGFVDVTEQWDVGDGFSPTFQSTFLDIDRDGDLDLFLITDRDGFYNKFYRNNGATFEEVGNEVNLNHDMWSMSNTIDDFNNDGMLDVYITNGTDGNILLQNDLNASGEFLDLTDDMGVAIEAFCWSAGFTDYDNDGWKDLWVLSEPYFTNDGEHFLFQNEQTSFSLDIGSGVFESTGRSFGYAQGDFDNDGFQDAVTNSMPILGTQIWHNTAEGGNFIEIGLKGLVSNSDGIGSYIDVHVDQQIFTAYTLCGENYYGQNSHVKHIGLGEYETVDSVVVTWPSHHVDTWYDVLANSIYQFAEGTSISASIVASIQNPCAGDTVFLSVPGNWSEYSWSTTDTTSTIAITSSQTVSVGLVSEFGIPHNVSGIEVNFNQPVTADASITHVDCYGSASGAIDFTGSVEQLDSIAWDNGSNEFLVTELQHGWHIYQLWDSLGCSQMDSVFINQPADLIAYYNVSDATCFNLDDGLVTIDSLAGGTGTISFSIDGYELDALPAGDYELLAIDSLGCEWMSAITISSPPEIVVNTIIDSGTTENTQQITIEIDGGTPPYNTSWSTGENDVTTVDNLEVDTYEVVVADSLGCEHTEVIVLTNVLTLTGSTSKIFPNPVDELLIIDYGDLVNYAIYDATGKLMLQETLVASNPMHGVSVKTLPEGIYLIVLYDGRYSHRFVKR